MRVINVLLNSFKTILLDSFLIFLKEHRRYIPQSHGISEVLSWIPLVLIFLLERKGEGVKRFETLYEKGGDGIRSKGWVERVLKWLKKRKFCFRWICSLGFKVDFCYDRRETETNNECKTMKIGQQIYVVHQFIGYDRAGFRFSKVTRGPDWNFPGNIRTTCPGETQVISFMHFVEHLQYTIQGTYS